ncbi:MAG: HPr family phosphocarrier protein [Candidatus Pacearchaeota archaeon]
MENYKINNYLEDKVNAFSTSRANNNSYKELYAELRIINKHGLHARPAAAFVKTASRYDAKVIVETEDGKRASGKSIMGLMTLELSQGRKMRLYVRGNGDAYECFEKLKTLVNSGFEED